MAESNVVKHYPVAHFVRDEEVLGSIHATPTIKTQSQLITDLSEIVKNGVTITFSVSFNAPNRSLRANLKWLFTWYDNIELGIPNTTNAIDGHFADLKNKLSHQVYSWQVALQQSLLPFNLTK